MYEHFVLVQSSSLKLIPFFHVSCHFQNGSVALSQTGCKMPSIELERNQFRLYNTLEINTNYPHFWIHRVESSDTCTRDCLFWNGKNLITHLTDTFIRKQLNFRVELCGQAHAIVCISYVTWWHGQSGEEPKCKEEIKTPQLEPYTHFSCQMALFLHSRAHTPL